MTGDHPRRDRSRRVSPSFGSPWTCDKWHAKSPARGKCPAILPHRRTLSCGRRGVSVLTFIRIDEAWVSLVNRAQSAVGAGRYPQGSKRVAACPQARSSEWFCRFGERRVER